MKTCTSFDSSAVVEGTISDNDIEFIAGVKSS